MASSFSHLNSTNLLCSICRMTDHCLGFFYLSSPYICTLFHAYHPDPGSSGFFPSLPPSSTTIPVRLRVYALLTRSSISARFPLHVSIIKPSHSTRATQRQPLP
ncbi:hypothetical protein J3F84DRAFT_363629 [Trichoderma pleuroticola]